MTVIDSIDRSPPTDSRHNRELDALFSSRASRIKGATSNWDDLRVFLAVARQGGLMSACRALGVDHTTVARRMTALEMSMGARLIDRSPQGTSLTAAGAALLEHVERIESELIRASDRLKAIDGQLGGSVRLATPEAFGVLVFAQRMKEFAQRAPHVEIELMADGRPINLSNREADVWVSLERPSRGRVHVQKLSDYSLGLYASREYMEEFGPVREIEDLVGRPLVVYSGQSGNLHEGAAPEDIPDGMRAVFHSTTIAAQQVVVSSGLGFGILPVFRAESNPNLVRVLPNVIDIKRCYWMSVHSDIREAPRVRAVMSFLCDLVRGPRQTL